jgi:pimeloyl-ACP methyl ester carboxylesterase/tetratricopeptide (TPR) repeat protein
MSGKKIVLNGSKNKLEESANNASGNYLQLKASYSLSASRAEGEKHELDITKDELIEFIFDDQTTWLGGSDALYELFPDIDQNKRGSGDAIELPFVLSSDKDARSIKSVALKVLNVFAKKTIKEGIKEIAQSLETKLLEQQSGVYRINSAFELVHFDVQKTDQPYLLFIHGTGSSTNGSFGELNGSDLWQEVKKIYGSNILAFQHETFTKSPLQNVAELLEQLPDDATLHLITHSRGGLVGEVLARYTGSENGFNEAGIAFWERIGRLEDVSNSNRIKNSIYKKKIKVEKFIRVACPARGTSLLSKRLDYFFNVSLNLLSISGAAKINPILEGFKTLLTAVIDSKSDVEVLPGLESMCPTSPFLKVLNAPDIIQGNLTVISGNAGFSLQLKALVVIVSKLVFKGDNDFVVNTTSMYQGAGRAQALQFYFDEGSDVNHFNYFKNSDTQKAILTALTSKEELLPEFKKYIPVSASSDQRGVFGIEGGSVFIDYVEGNKPIVVLLPGIMGSTLTKNGSPIWMNYLRVITGGLTDLEIGKPGIKANGLIKTSYKKLTNYLSDEYDVVTFPYDWRIPVAESAKALNDKIIQLRKHNQPIKIIAHSMGGLVAREFILNHTDTWSILNEMTGFKLVLLGTPWMGSYRIPNVLAGRDGIIKQLDALDYSHSKTELINLFAKFPGILNLLPVRKADPDFSDETFWKTFQQASGIAWTIPSKATLEEFGAFRKQVQEKVETIDYTNIRYVAGLDKETLKGFTIENGMLQFQATAKGDQSVTWESGIPEKLKDTTSTYYSNITHGDLANNTSLFQAIKQLINIGFTDLLSRLEPQVTEIGSRSLVQREEEEIFEIDEERAIHKIMGIPLEETINKNTLPPLHVSVSKGDLKFSSYPILIGHFDGDGIVSAERVADTYLKGELSDRHLLGDYPGILGSHEFISRKDDDFKGVIIIGLGDVDRLSAQYLSLSVEKAVISYLLDNSKKSSLGKKKSQGISTLLVGADYGGLTVESSLRSIISGIQSANIKVFAIRPDEINFIDHVEIVELFEDRALQCFYALKRLMTSTGKELNISFKTNNIKSLLGYRKRLLLENKSDWWQRLTVLAENDTLSNDKIKHLTFYAATNAAREEKKELQSSVALIESLIETISTDEKWTPEVAKTIFELLIPNDFKENLKRQTDILWVLDKYTASFPWELFQSDSEKTKPLCINAGMIRTLATGNYRTNIAPVNNKNILIIGDPLTYGFCNQLAGAEKEAKEVRKLFGAYDYDIESQIKKTSSEITTALFQREYKIIHISGHGSFDKEHPENSGMIIGNNVFLTPREFNQLSYTPELVFVNCCFLGKIDAAQEELYQGRYKFAANIGTQLIENGVKAVVAAGWAVDDAAALEFANVFYTCMFDGYEFGKAVMQARKVIYENHKHTNTWGAFQCYGDPFYKLKLTGRKVKRSRDYTIAQEAENDVDNMLSRAQISFFDSNTLHEELDEILKAVNEKEEIKTPEVLERIAFAYAEMNDYQKAIDIFREVLRSEVASFSVSSLEKFNNILGKQILQQYIAKSAIKRDYEKDMQEVIESLCKLMDISPTKERFSLIGSAYKRKSAICKKREDIIEALHQAATFYYKAYEKDPDEGLYPMINWIQIEYFLVAIGEHKWNSKSKNEAYKLPSLKNIKASFEKSIEKLNQKMLLQSYDYYDVVGRANASLCVWLLKNAPKGNDLQSLIKAYNRVWEFVGSKNKKMAEIEQIDILLHCCALLPDKKVYKSIVYVKEELMKSIK